MNDKIISLINNILASDLTLATKEKIVRHYMLPEVGRTKAIIQDEPVEVGTVDRPSAEDIRIEENPKLKEEYLDTTRVMEKIE